MKIPMPVLLTICSEINKSNLAQIRSAEMEVELPDEIKSQLAYLSILMSDRQKARWIERELEIDMGARYHE